MFEFFEGLIEKLGVKLISDFNTKLFNFIENVKKNSEKDNNDSDKNSAQIGNSGDWVQIGSSGNRAQIGSSGNGAQIGSSGNGAQIGSSGNGAQIGSSGNSAQIGNSGDWVQIGSSGNRAQIGSSGNGAQIGSSGYGAQIGSSGNGAQIGSSGNGAQIGSSGNSAQIGNSGDWVQIGSSGNRAQIGSSGNGAQIGSSGNGAQIGSSGNGAQIGSSGNSAQIGNSGDWVQIGSSGNRAQIGSSGNGAQIGSSGYGAQIGSSGNGAQIGSSGNGAQIGSSGYGAQIDISGENSIGFACGYKTIIKAKNGTWISLAEYGVNEQKNIIPVFAKCAQIGNKEYKDYKGKMLKEDTYYILWNKEFYIVENYDEIWTIKLSEHKKENIKIIKAIDIDDLLEDKIKEIYIATEGDLSAHGYTVREAIEDLTLKKLDNINKDEIIAEIKKKGKVTRSQYRAITGACSFGTNKFCEDHNIQDLEEIELTELRKILINDYGAEKFWRLIDEN